MPAGEMLLALPEPIPRLRNVRSTTLVVSLDVIRKTERIDAYRKLLPEEHHAVVLDSVPGTWIPAVAALAHYRACDGLGLSTEAQFDVGREASERVGSMFFGTLTRLAKQAGASPNTIFPHLQKIWHRGYDGGGISVEKVGPKEANLNLVEFPLCESVFYRHALRAWVITALRMFTTQIYVHPKKAIRDQDAVAFRLQWV